MGYKLARPEPGDFLSDGRESLVVAANAEQAKGFFEVEYGARPDFVHPRIARGRIVYQRDIDNGDSEKGAKAGDTTFGFSRDDGRRLVGSEFRVWAVGPIKPGWMIRPLGFKGDGFAVIVGNEKVGEAPTYERADRLRQEAEQKVVEAWKKEQ
jgi:hypothetical protein